MCSEPGASRSARRARTHKAGGDGAAVSCGEGDWHAPARPIVPVDTTAAGDCFEGVLAAALDRGSSLIEALGRATAAAALCCTKPGSQGSLPWAADTDAFYRPATG